MKYTNELMLMIAKFLYGEYDAERFSFDFPATLSDAYDAFSRKTLTCATIWKKKCRMRAATLTRITPVTRIR